MPLSARLLPPFLAPPPPPPLAFLTLSPSLFHTSQRQSKRVAAVRAIIREVAGMAPYEKRIGELLKTGRDKRALKFAKRKLGTHGRGLRKRAEVADILRKQAAKK